MIPFPRLLAAVVVAAFLGAWGSPGPAEDCASLRATIAQTYDFSPSKLNDKQIAAKSKLLDAFWDSVKARPEAQLPCLRAALADSTTSSFFRFDGSNLLVTLDSSDAAKRLQIAAYTTVDLADVQYETWVGTLTWRAFEGFNTTAPAERWLFLKEKEAQYVLIEHGGYVVSQSDAALFLYGAMPESIATPALMAIAAKVDHPGRETALWLLSKQATAESREALVADSSAPMSKNTRKQIRQFLTDPPATKPRAKPQITRMQYLTAFEAIQQVGNRDMFMAIADRVPDGEKDAAAVMLPEDLPLLRWIRRYYVKGGNQHSLEWYADFTGIILAVEAKRTPK